MKTAILLLLLLLAACADQGPCDAACQAHRDRMAMMAIMLTSPAR